MNMKKLVALLLALVMVFALCACGPKDNQDTGKKDDGKKTAMKADDIPDEMTSSDGKYQVAFVTDVGDLKDKSFNQGTYDGVKLYANANSKSYKYYKPANGDKATDDDRYDAMKAAVDNGAEVVVAAGFLQGAALEKAAKEFTDTKFVFIDGSPIDGVTNLAAISFREEQCGYLAGYAAVMEGYTKLGFCGGGGGTNDACCRYGYGYVQGAEAAAAVKGVNVAMNYTWLYGASFQASPELQTLASGWYENGTEVIFSCGGSIFDSITAAAAANDAYVIGVDVDQAGIIDSKYGDKMTVTSAMKGLAPTVKTMLTEIMAGNWDKYAGKVETLGLVSGDDPTQNYVQLPMDTTQWTDSFTQDNYKSLVKDMFDGKITVSNDITKAASDFATVITVEDLGNIK